jgi:hypothetical protein
MNPKIIKLREEHAKNKAKITDLSTRNREIEKQLRGLENTEIIGLVRAQGMSLEDFFALMQAQNPIAAAIPITNEQEEADDEKAELEET